jgi:zona occludens toxin (predicted ATPase)
LKLTKPQKVKPFSVVVNTVMTKTDLSPALVDFNEAGFEKMARFFYWVPEGALILMDERG